MIIKRFGKVFAGFAFAYLMLCAGTANAQSTATDTFLVTLTLEDECVVTAGIALDFDAAGVLDVALTGTTTIDVQCTDQTAYSVGLNEGTGVGATVLTRYLTGPGGVLVLYELYQDAGHLTIWGNTPPTNTVAGTGDGDTQTLTVYGLVPVQVTPVAGNYTDTITVTVTY